MTLHNQKDHGAPAATDAVRQAEIEQQLAESHRQVRPSPHHRIALLANYGVYKEGLTRAQRYFAEIAENELLLPYAGEWLLDNYYVIQQALRMVKDDMPRGYYDKLPALTTTEMAGYPRIYALACYILDASTAALSVADIISLCQRYQQKTPLEIGELWALPTMLRAHLIENILEALRGIAKLEDVLPVRMPFRNRAGDDPTDIVANSIMSLRALAYQDWNEFFEAVSLVESALRMDPAGIYTRMDEPTRNRYREAVERIAERTGCGEETIAQAAVACARESAAQSKSSASLPFQPVGPGYREYAAHVGYYLVDEGRATLERSVGHQSTWVQYAKHQAATNRTLLYLGSVLALTAILLLIVVRLAFGYLGSPLQLIVTLLLALFPVSTTAIQIVDWCVMRWIPPRLLPRLDFHDGIPEQFRTFVVMPVLISTTEEIDALFDHLEMHYLRNKDDCLHFALLADFPDAPEAHQPDDDALIHYAGQCVEALNARAGDRSRFFFFLRKRRWNPGEQTWMGWERKRGKLAMFNQLLLKPDAPTDYTVQFGDLSILPTIRYVITLDADTILPRDQAQALIGTLAHPLNRAVYSTHERALAHGYSILQPRVEILQLATQQSPFTRLFVGATGLDLYTLAVSNLYQDLFGEAIYVGKGIYDVAAFEHGLEGCVPENALLSHDLYEGIHGRVGLVTDVAFIEDYPTHYLAHQLRIHRWIRGDWQLLPWLWRRAPAHRRPQDCSQFSVINTWKIIDNLRRSLVFPALLAFFICAWLGILPGSDQFAAALLWTALGLLFSFSPFVGALFSHIASLGSRPSQNTIRSSFSADMTRWALSIAFLAYEALLAIDAIVTTIYRLIRRRKLLQWTTAAHTNRLFGENAGEDSVIWQQMTPLSTMVVGLVVLMILTYPQHLAIAAPLLVAWALSPILIKYISRPIPEARPELLAGDRRELRRLARRTWLYFEEFVGPASHWLPPDHFQEKPHAKTVYSTSPTNIGLLMLSTLTAYDLGYIGTNDVAVRLRLTIDTLDKLERYRGHLLNWYDAQTLDPLPPRYVSTVDSGNLVGCLIALRQGIKELADRPVVDGRRWQGLLDLLAILDDLVQAIEPDEPVKLRSRRAALESAEGRPEQWPSLLAVFTAEDIPELGQTLVSFLETHRHNLEAAQISEVRLYLDRIRQHSINFQRDLDRFVPWLSILARPSSELGPVDSPAYTAYQDILTTLRTIPTFGEAEAVYQHVLDQITLARDTMRTQAGREVAIPWLDELTRSVEKAGATARELQNAYADLDRRALGWIESHDFCFLFDDERCIFHIGYDVSAERLDGSYYDLLASEARIASYVALAKGDVPQEHWLHLGRPMTTVQNTVALLSWSGTVFEYLMPALLMRDYPSTLLHESYRAVVDQQMAYAHERGVPWGISESGYHTLDSSSNYQYRAFGVPHLAFKRGLDTDLVIAPYASLLALPIRPDAVLKNIAHLKRIEALGAYGFYEAVDFTPRHLALGEAYAVVREYMAHHQGMILVAVNNMLNDDTMIRRFHADPRIQSIDLLLQEKIPTQPNLQYPEAERQETPVATTTPTAGPWTVPIDVPQPYVHGLSNGRYHVVISSTGGGYSQWQGLDLTRWQPDAALDAWGSWIYAQDLDSGRCWSAGYAPTAVMPEQPIIRFHPHMAEFIRRDEDISLKLEVTVHPHDDVEIRRVTLTNHSDQARRLRLVSYAEIILAPQTADQRHPAFNKLFIQSEYLPPQKALLFHRRPRSNQDLPVFMLHRLVSGVYDLNVVDSEPQFEADRARFLGRYQTVRSPQVLAAPQNNLSGTAGSTLDPIMALAQGIHIAPYTSVEIAFVTGAADSRAQIETLAARYGTWSAVEKTFNLARYESIRELHQANMEPIQLEDSQKLLSALLYPRASMRAQSEILAANTRAQNALWTYGISGDYPIILVKIGALEQLPLIQELLLAHTYWRKRGIPITLVILNQLDTGYLRELYHQIHRLIVRADSEMWIGRHDGIFILGREQMTAEADRILLETAARVIVDGAHGGLTDQLQHLTQERNHLPAFHPTDSSSAEPSPPLLRPADWQFDNGTGGFSSDGREYQIYLEPGQATPAPWSNVIANPDFGFLVTETGGGFTWSSNSSEYRLTTWRNDPVADQPVEALYLRDEETAEIWTPTPLPAPASAPYLIRHGAGYTIFEHHGHGLEQRLTLYVAPEAPVKVVRLQVKNTWSHTRRIIATYYAEWVLGTDRTMTGMYLIPEYDGANHTLLVRNPYSLEFGEHYAFLTGPEPFFGLTTDRAEFIGNAGSLQSPAALQRIGLAGTVEAGRDICAAVQYHLDIAPGDTAEVIFVMGTGASRAEALERAQQYQNPQVVERAWTETQRLWDRVLRSVIVETPDPGVNLLMPWLLYQTIACRLWGRSAFYQSGGAFGFRDQLQDVMAVLHTRPDLARTQILRAASHQFEAGDVLHWWHPPSGRGVRTRFSDDLVWLPFVVAQYVKVTGDQSILHEEVPFLRGEPLRPGEDERYGLYEETPEHHTLFEHCLRALNKGFTAGVHGLPLMGTGDWNDGMNRVGIEGQGESVWMGWFLYAALTEFLPCMEYMGEPSQANRYRQRLVDLVEALEQHAWDGDWYLRAFYDDGTPLGSATSSDCKIDSIAQSWAVISGAADAKRAAQAMQAVDRWLVRPNEKLVLLFQPPFDQSSQDPGYIQGYVPGIRENGGQYTHAALWVLWAFARLRRNDQVGRLLKLLNPIYHADTPEKAARYRVEPYVIAADVYSVTPHIGRGGWTWYTGSAGWMYRVILEMILGIQRVGDSLMLEPVIPPDWPGFKIIYTWGSTTYRIEASVDNQAEAAQVWLDEHLLPDLRIPLTDDARLHQVYMKIPPMREIDEDDTARPK